MSQALLHRKRIAELVLESALLGPELTTDVCEHCGVDRDRAQFYGDPCRGDESIVPLGAAPAPSIGEHSFVRVSTGRIARPYSVGRIQQDQHVMLFVMLAQKIPVRTRFSNAAELEAWALREMGNHPRGMDDGLRERVRFVGSMMWSALQEAANVGLTLDQGELLVDIALRARRGYFRTMATLSTSHFRPAPAKVAS